MAQSAWRHLGGGAGSLVWCRGWERLMTRCRPAGETLETLNFLHVPSLCVGMCRVVMRVCVTGWRPILMGRNKTIPLVKFEVEYI